MGLMNEASVKQQHWGQLRNKHPAVHRPGRLAEVVVCLGHPEPDLGPHGFPGLKWLIEKVKMALSTENAALYYYDQVKRFK